MHTTVLPAHTAGSHRLRNPRNDDDSGAITPMVPTASGLVKL